MSGRQWNMTDTRWAVLIATLCAVFILVVVGMVMVTDGTRHARNQCEDVTTHKYLLANYEFHESVRLAELEC